MPRRNRSQAQPHMPLPIINCDQKTAYRSQKAADDAAEIAMLQKPTLTLDTYRCPHCRWWHLTSKKH